MNNGYNVPHNQQQYAGYAQNAQGFLPAISEEQYRQNIEMLERAQAEADRRANEAAQIQRRLQAMRMQTEVAFRGLGAFADNQLMGPPFLPALPAPPQPRLINQTAHVPIQVRIEEAGPSRQPNQPNGVAVHPQVHVHTQSANVNVASQPRQRPPVATNSAPAVQPHREQPQQGINGNLQRPQPVQPTPVAYAQTHPVVWQAGPSQVARQYVGPTPPQSLPRYPVTNPVPPMTGPSLGPSVASQAHVPARPAVPQQTYPQGGTGRHSEPREPPRTQSDPRQHSGIFPVQGITANRAETSGSLAQTHRPVENSPAQPPTREPEGNLERHTFEFGNMVCEALIPRSVATELFALKEKGDVRRQIELMRPYSIRRVEPANVASTSGAQLVGLPQDMARAASTAQTPSNTPNTSFPRLPDRRNQSNGPSSTRTQDRIIIDLTDDMPQVVDPLPTPISMPITLNSWAPPLESTARIEEVFDTPVETNARNPAVGSNSSPQLPAQPSSSIADFRSVPPVPDQPMARPTNAAPLARSVRTSTATGSASVHLRESRQHPLAGLSAPTKPLQPVTNVPTTVVPPQSHGQPPASTSDPRATLVSDLLAQLGDDSSDEENQPVAKRPRLGDYTSSDRRPITPPPEASAATTTDNHSGPSQSRQNLPSTSSALLSNPWREGSSTKPITIVSPSTSQGQDAPNGVASSSRAPAPATLKVKQLSPNDIGEFAVSAFLPSAKVKPQTAAVDPSTLAPVSSQHTARKASTPRETPTPVPELPPTQSVSARIDHGFWSRTSDSSSRLPFANDFFSLMRAPSSHAEAQPVARARPQRTPRKAPPSTPPPAQHPQPAASSSKTPNGEKERVPLFLSSESESSTPPIPESATPNRKRLVAEVVIRTPPRSASTANNLVPREQGSTPPSTTPKRLLAEVVVPYLSPGTKKQYKRLILDRHQELASSSVSDEEQKHWLELEAASLRRGVMRGCSWNGCPARLDTGERLVRHMQVVHGSEIFDEECVCRWDGCRATLSRDQFPAHIVGHCCNIMLCPVDDCDQEFRLYSELARHVREDHRSKSPLLGPEPKPYMVEPPEPPPPLPKSLPACYDTLVTSVEVYGAPISHERHMKLGPWVLRNIYGHADLELPDGISSNPVRLSERLAGRDEEEPPFRVDSQEYSFLPSSPSRLVFRRALESQEATELARGDWGWGVAGTESGVGRSEGGQRSPGTPSMGSTVSDVGVVDALL